jgi:ParB-like chromosome segregation protein Spo0J
MSQELEGMAIDLHELVPHPGNPRRGRVETIKRSLTRFGQMRPILVGHSDGVIIAGNHTYLAAQELGWEKIACVYTDLPDDEATAYMLMDNRSSDEATWDDDGLLIVLKDMERKDLLDATGFNIDDIEDLVAALDAVRETEVEQFSGDYTESSEETAQRWENRNEGANREIVLLLPRDQYEPFMQAVAILKQHYDLESAAQTIFRAVTTHAEVLHAESSAS